MPLRHRTVTPMGAAGGTEGFAGDVNACEINCYKSNTFVRQAG